MDQPLLRPRPRRPGFTYLAVRHEQVRYDGRSPGGQDTIHFGGGNLRGRRRTPRHAHQTAHEMFYVLSGRGRASCGGKTYDVEKGDTLVLPPGTEHVVENTGPDRLYCLTVMVPNEGFAEMIRNGSTQSLDEADRAVIIDS